VRLSEIVARAGVTPVRQSGDPVIESLSIDSRTIRPGGMFVCMPGMTTDSQAYLSNAATLGASAAMVYDVSGVEVCTSLGLPYLQFGTADHQFEDSVWRLCDTFFDHPSRNLKVCGVTGTNGKTTTAWILRDMMAAWGLKSAYLGTLGIEWGDDLIPLANTTPFAVDLYNYLDDLRTKGCEVVTLEASSHALDQRRLDGVEFDAAVFTNLTQDHLDYHGTMEKYEDAKWRLFSDLPGLSTKPFIGVLNVDDPVGKKWSDRIEYPSLRFGLDASATLWASQVEVGLTQIKFRLHSCFGGYTEESFDATAPLGGAYNVENLLAATAAATALGVPLADACCSLSRVRPAPGRFEPIPNSEGITVLVDYAHTPDALQKLLLAVRSLTNGRIHTVFGCGGDRDALKRPLMASAASNGSDVTIVTSDNPRTEDPEAIFRDMKPGLQQDREWHWIPDRQKAIERAIGSAEPSDVVIIAGKGHEKYQIIGKDKRPFDDREAAVAALSRRGGRN
jgi:UDP-N-acetylmuramoyl-L-alanyl-D-glutamate--2,6-diaminopimelate ligase